MFKRTFTLAAVVFFFIAAATLPAHAVVIAEFDFSTSVGDRVPNLGVGPDGTLLNGAEVVDGVLRTEGVGSALDIPLGVLSPFGGATDWSVQFDFRTEDEGGGPLFSSDNSDCPDDCENDGGNGVGSLNIFLTGEGEVVADAWYIGAIGAEGGFNDGEFHTVRLDFLAEESLWSLFVDDLEEPAAEEVFEYSRDATLDRTRVADQTNDDFGFEDIDPGEDGIAADFDNIIIDAPAPPPVLVTVNRDTGAIILESISSDDLSLSSLSISSASGSLNPEFWTPITGNLDSNGDSSVASGPWTIDSSEPELLSESGENGTLAAGQIIELGGDGLWLASPLEDIRVEVFDAELEEAVRGAISYDGEEMLFADLNLDGEVGLSDWEAFVEGFGSDLSSVTGREGYFLGDLNGDGEHNSDDFIEFSIAFDEANGAGAFAAMTASIPEPTGFALLGMSVFGLLLFRSRKNRYMKATTSALLVAVVATAIAGNNSANADLLAEYNFEDGTTDSSGNGRDGDLDEGIFGDGSPTVADGVLNLTGFVGESMIIPLDDANPFDGSSDFTIDLSFRAFPHEDDGAGHLLFSSADFDQPSEGDNHSMAVFIEPEGDIVYDNFFVGEVRLTPPEFVIDDGIMHDLRITYQAPEEVDPDDPEPGQMFMRLDGAWLGTGEIAPNVPDIANHEVRLGSSLNEDFPFECAEGECFIRDFMGDLDNVSIYDEAFIPSNMRAEVDRATGDVKLIGGEFQRVVKYYELSSDEGSLNPTSWEAGSLGAQGIDTIDDGVGASWDALDSTASRVVEGFLLGSTQFDEETSITLPGVWSGVAEDLALEFVSSDNEVFGVEVSYVGEGEGNPYDPIDIFTNLCEAEDPQAELAEAGFLAGDLNFDGEVGFTDFLTLSGNFNENDLGYNEGDIDCNGTVGFTDFLTLSQNFGKVPAQAAASVPEPTSGLLFCLGGMLGLVFRRRR